MKHSGSGSYSIILIFTQWSIKAEIA